MKKRYISIFLIIITVAALLTYHLFPRNMKDLVLEDRNIVDSVKVYSFDTEMETAKMIDLVDGELASFLSLLNDTNAHIKIAKKEYFHSTKYYRIFVHEAGVGTRSTLCDIEFYYQENIITVNGVQYAINDPKFPEYLDVLFEH